LAAHQNQPRKGNCRERPDVRIVASLVSAAFLLVASTGCHGGDRHASSTQSLSPPTTRLSPTTFVSAVDAGCAPPIGWTAEPLKQSPRHYHQVWLSPTRRTAYGVIHFDLPFPVGYDLVLWFFMREMKRSEGEAKLVSKNWDANLQGMKFVAEGGRYTIRTNLLLRGLDGWAIYAGTLNGEPIIPEELELAEQARDFTQTGNTAR
jgi:hypothetical protein